MEKCGFEDLEDFKKLSNNNSASSISEEQDNNSSDKDVDIIVNIELIREKF